MIFRGGVYWTKFECISGKIQMIKNTNADETKQSYFAGGNGFALSRPYFAPPPARMLGGQNPERKTPFPFSKEISPPPNQKYKECFFFRGCWRTRQCVGLSPSVRFNSEPPRASRVPPSGFEKAVEFCIGALGRNRTCIADRTLVLDFKNAFKIAEKYHAEAQRAEATSCDFTKSENWRRGRDSNPREVLPSNTLAVCHFRPLSHLSIQ